MDDDEIQVVEVTVRTGSPNRKRKRRESLTLQKTTETPSSNDLVSKAAQLKRRLAFCQKEQEELSKRFKEIQKQLSEEQSLELNVKLETSDKRTPLICVGDNSDSDDDVVFILPEDYSPLKRRKLDDAKKAETFENSGDQPKKDVSITYFKPGTSLPHAREHCAVHRFVQSNVTTATVSCNESYCEQCYCYVCDAPVKECESWKTGTNPHCNGYAKNTFWEKLRKMAKRKTTAVQDSLLKSLPADEQTESMKEAASKVTELLETLKGEVNDVSSNFNSRSSSPSCGCECHYDSDYCYGDGEGCDGCYEEHERGYCAYDWPFGRYGGWVFSLSSNVSNTVSKATDYLKSGQPGQAAIVLDALTVVLLAADNDSNRWPYGEVTASLRSLRKAWIEVLMHPDLPKNVEDKVRERLKNANDGALICSPDGTGLKVVLEMKKWNDESLVKCLAGKLDDFIKEDEEVAEARLAFFEKNKRFTDALSYMLGCKVSQRSFSYGMNSSVERRLANISQYRNKFIVLLAKAGKTDQAFHVITVPSSVELDKDILTNTSSKVVGSSGNYSQSALGTISYSNMTELLSAIVSDNSSTETGKLPSPQIIPETKLRKVLALILTGAQVNSSLRSDAAMEWYINTFCESSLSNNLAKDVRQKFTKEAEEVVKKAKTKLLDPSEIKPPFNGPFKVFVVELFAALGVSLFTTNNYYMYQSLCSITRVMEALKKKNLHWACVSVVLSPAISSKITPPILSFVLENVMKPLGSSCIPFEVYESWMKTCSDMNGIETNYEIAVWILKEGKQKPGCYDAVPLAKKIVGAIETMLGRASSWNKDKIAAVLKKMKKDFGPVLKDLEWKIMSLSFKSDPSYANFEGVRKSCKKENWPQLRTSMIDFLKKHRTSHTACCIDVFAQCSMFDEVKKTLSATGYTNSYPSVCEKIRQTLSKLKKSDACQFVDACSDWLSKTLCDGAFQNWRYRYKYTPEAVLSCLKAIADVKIQTFNNILSAAVQQAAIIFDTKTVQVKHRSDLEQWLKDIKELYSSKQQMTAWSWTFHKITTGQLKRKPAVIRQLKNSYSLSLGTIPYHQLLKMEAATNTLKPAQGNTVQAGKLAASTPNNAASAKPAQGTTVQAGKVAASTPNNAPSAKPAQGTSVPKQVVNIAASTPTNTASAKPVQGTAASKQAVNMATITPSNTSSAKPAKAIPSTSQAARVVLAPKQVNISSSTTVNTSGIRTPVPVQLTNVNKAAPVLPNATLQQELNRCISSNHSLVAVTDKSGNLVVRLPPVTTVSATTTPTGGFVAIAPKTTTNSLVSSASSTVQTTSVSASSTKSNSASSAGSRG